MRQLIIDAIITEYRKHGQKNQEHILRDSLRYIVSDTNLIVFAQEVGVDTDALLNPEGHRHAANVTCPTCEVRS